MRSKNNELMDNILEYIDNKHFEEHYCPTMQEIATKFDISKSTAHSYISELEAKGLLKRQNLNGRFDLVTNRSSKIETGLFNVPIVGEIACGTPILAQENIEDYVYISKYLLGNGDFFALRTKGDSMIDAGIYDGDIVIVNKQNTAEEGQIVVALIDDEATLKRYYRDDKRKQIRLHPENKAMSDLYFDKVDIQGVVKKVIKDIK